MDFIRTLPNVVVIHILQLLPLPDLVTCTSVSHAWRSYLLSNKGHHNLFKTLYFPDLDPFNALSVSNVNQWMERTGAQLRKLSIRVPLSYEFLDRGTPVDLTHLYSSRGLVWRNEKTPMFSGLLFTPDGRPKYPNMESVHLDVSCGVRVTDHWRFLCDHLFQLSKLRSLTIINPETYITDRNLNLILTSCLQLKELNLEGSRHYLSGSGFHTPQSEFAKLHLLNIKGNNITEAAFNHITEHQCSSLEELRIEDVDCSPDLFVHNLVRFKRLAVLDVHSDQKVGTDYARLFAHSTQLRSLVLFNALEFNDRAAQSLARNLGPSIRDLNLYGVTDVSCSTWAVLIKSLTNIRSLSLSLCRNANSAMFEHVSGSLTNLSLGLSTNSEEKISDSVVDYLAARATKLAILNVSLTDLSLAALTRAVDLLPSLAYLYVNKTHVRSVDDYLSCTPGANRNIKVGPK